MNEWAGQRPGGGVREPRADRRPPSCTCDSPTARGEAQSRRSDPAIPSAGRGVSLRTAPGAAIWRHPTGISRSGAAPMQARRRLLVALGFSGVLQPLHVRRACGGRRFLGHLARQSAGDHPADTGMPPDNYGFSPRFCWVADRYGVTWQLNLAHWQRGAVSNAADVPASAPGTVRLSPVRWHDRTTLQEGAERPTRAHRIGVRPSETVAVRPHAGLVTRGPDEGQSRAPLERVHR